MRANSKRSAVIPLPKRLPRPGDDTGELGTEPRRMSTKTEIAAFMRQSGGAIRYSPRGGR